MRNQNSAKKSTVRKVLSLVKRLDKGYLPFMVLAKFIVAIQPFLILWAGSRILDMILKRNTMEEIMHWVLVVVLCTLLLNVVRLFLENALSIKGKMLGEQINRLITEKSLKLDYEVLEKHETLEMIHRAKEGMTSNGNITSFCEQLGTVVEGIAGIVYSLILFLPVCFPKDIPESSTAAGILNAWWSPFGLLAAGVLVLCTRQASQKAKGKEAQQNFDRNVSYNRRFVYFWSFFSRYKEGKDIRMYQMQDMIIDGIQECNTNNEKNSRIMMRLVNRHMVGDWVRVLVLEGASYFYVGLKAIFGFISVGSVLQYVGAFGKLCDGLGGITGLYITIDVQSKYLSLFEDFMALENKKYEGTLPIEKRDDNRYEIEFRDVSFRYPNSAEFVLSHVNAKLRIGEKTAIVGPNGAGKTTFIKLLCRLYDPTEGEILLNGRNIKEYNLQKYRALFATAFQDHQMLSLSVMENVLMRKAKPEDEEQVVNALKLAGVYDKVQTLPQGIHSILTREFAEDGQVLSGGEYQKIVVARAFVKNCPIKIFDEPSSALDPIAEYQLFDNILKSGRDKTMLFISHRLSSVQNADWVFMLEDGMVKEEGTHKMLMKMQGLYADMYDKQAENYLATERSKVTDGIFAAGGEV